MENIRPGDNKPTWSRYGHGRKSNRLQRKSSLGSLLRPDNNPPIDPADLLRKSPTEFDKDFSVPVPTPPRESLTLTRPPAARHASSSSLAPRRPYPSTKELPRVPSSLPALRTRVAKARTPRAGQPVPAPARVMSVGAALPRDWNVSHDRAICVLDARNYSYEQSIRKLRRAFPELVGHIITTEMVERRLRRMDQDVDVNYWRIGLMFASRHRGEHRGDVDGSGGSIRVRPSLESLSSISTLTVGLKPPPSQDSSETSIYQSFESEHSTRSSGSSAKFRNKWRPSPLLGPTSLVDGILKKATRPMSRIEERPGSTASVSAITDRGGRKEATVQEE